MAMCGYIQGIKQDICLAIDRHRDALVDFGEDIFRHPELGYREYRTSEKVRRAFEDMGLCDISVCGVTGVKGWLPGSRDKGLPRIAVIGEMDAVLSLEHPAADKGTGAAHACGHHAGLTAMLGACAGLKEVAPSLAGNVCFMAVPAEEYVELAYRTKLRDDGIIRYLGGKQQLIWEGCFDDIDIAMMVHAQTDAPGAKVCVHSSAGGFIGKTVQFIGKEAHAGGAPHLGVNALNAAAAAIMCIHAQRETFRDEDRVRVHPVLTKGGDIVNTVPADVRMESYVRAANIPAMQEANARVNRAVRGASYAIGTKVKLNDLPGYLPLAESLELSRVFAENAKVLLPDAAVVQDEPFCGSTDMGDLSYMLPVIQPTVSGFTGALHSKDFAVANKELAYVAPAKLMAMTVAELLADGGMTARSIIRQFPRKTRKDFGRLWDSILEEKDTEMRDML